MKNFLLTLMSVSKEISLFKPKSFMDKTIVNTFKTIWYILFNNTRIDE